MKTCQAVNETINMKDLNEMDQVLHKCYGVIDSAKVHHRTKYASRQTLLATIKTDVCPTNCETFSLTNIAIQLSNVPCLIARKFGSYKGRCAIAAQMGKGFYGCSKAVVADGKGWEI